jgi:hypothetical protein
VVHLSVGPYSRIPLDTTKAICILEDDALRLAENLSAVTFTDETIIVYKVPMNTHILSEDWIKCSEYRGKRKRSFSF